MTLMTQGNFEVFKESQPTMEVWYALIKENFTLVKPPIARMNGVTEENFCQDPAQGNITARAFFTNKDGISFLYYLDMEDYEKNIGLVCDRYPDPDHTSGRKPEIRKYLPQNIKR